MEEISMKNGNQGKLSAKRPFLLTLLCLFSFVFFGLISLSILLALFWAGTIADMVLRYAPEHSVQRFYRVFLYPWRIGPALIIPDRNNSYLEHEKDGLPVVWHFFIDNFHISIICNPNFAPDYCHLYSTYHCLWLFP